MQRIASPYPAAGGTIFRYDIKAETRGHYETALEAARLELAGLPVPAAAKAKTRTKAKPDAGDDAAIAAARRIELEQKVAFLEPQIARLKAEAPIVFLLNVPTYFERIEHEAALDSQAYVPSSVDLAPILLEEARRLFGEGSPELELAGDYAAELERLNQADLARVENLCKRMRLGSATINDIYVVRDRRAKLARYLLVKAHLRGWEGLDRPFERDAIGCTDETISLLAEWFDVVAGRIQSLMTLSGDARKNLLRPSLKASSPASSTAA